jgi:YVTN family beta-propeller protein
VRPSSVTATLAVVAATLPSVAAAGGRPLDPAEHSARTILLAPLPLRAERACAALQNRVSFRLLCPRLLPRAVVGFPGQPPPTLVATFIRRDPRHYTGIDFSYGAPWEGPGWRRHAWRNRPCCFLHFVIERLSGRVPAGARPIVLGGKQGRILPASSRTFYGGLYFANHVRFFFREDRLEYVATLHSFGNRETTRLLSRIVAGLRPAPFRASPHGLLLERPQALAPAADGVWTSGMDPGRLLRVGRNGHVSRTFRLRLTPLDLAVAGGSLWVAGYRGARAVVRRLDARTGRVVATIETGKWPKAVAASPKAVWAVDSAPFYRPGSAVRIDPARNRVTARVPLGRAPARVALGPESVWITDVLDGMLTRIDRRSARVVARIRVGGSPYGVAVAGGSVWVTNSDDGTVSRVDPATNRVTATIRVGRNPYGIAAAGGSVWVANLGSETIARIDLRTNRARRWARVPGDPFAIAVSRGAVWVTLNGEGTLRRMPLP